MLISQEKRISKLQGVASENLERKSLRNAGQGIQSGYNKRLRVYKGGD